MPFCCVITGTLKMAWDSDITKLTFLIFALFVYGSIRCGVLTYRLPRCCHMIDFNRLRVQNAHCQFIRNLLLKIGLLGTICGLLYMLTGLMTSLGNAQDLTSLVAVKDSMYRMIYGMATAFFTTATGLIGWILLSVQTFNITQYLDKQCINQ